MHRAAHLAAAHFAASALGAVVRRASALLVVLSLVSAVVFGGRSVLWCPWMQQVMKTECCHAKQEQDSDGPAFERSGCCETKVLPSVPTSKDARDSAMPVLELVALVVRPDAPWERDVSSLGSPFVNAEERGARAGPKVPIYVHNCAFLL